MTPRQDEGKIDRKTFAARIGGAPNNLKQLLGEAPAANLTRDRIGALRSTPSNWALRPVIANSAHIIITNRRPSSIEDRCVLFSRH
jgi:hypothetical protein